MLFFAPQPQNSCFSRVFLQCFWPRKPTPARPPFKGILLCLCLLRTSTMVRVFFYDFDHQQARRSLVMSLFCMTSKKPLQVSPVFCRGFHMRCRKVDSTALPPCLCCRQCCRAQNCSAFEHKIGQVKHEGPGVVSCFLHLSLYNVKLKIHFLTFCARQCCRARKSRQKHPKIAVKL
jgi:hypothetical protein